MFERDFDIGQVQERFPFIDGGGSDSDSSDSDTERGHVYELVEPSQHQRMLVERVELEEEATAL